jgi:hypothetical protein
LNIFLCIFHQKLKTIRPIHNFLWVDSKRRHENSEAWRNYWRNIFTNITAEIIYSSPFRLLLKRSKAKLCSASSLLQPTIPEFWLPLFIFFFCFPKFGLPFTIYSEFSMVYFKCSWNAEGMLCQTLLIFRKLHQPHVIASIWSSWKKSQIISDIRSQNFRFFFLFDLSRSWSDLLFFLPLSSYWFDYLAKKSAIDFSLNILFYCQDESKDKEKENESYWNEMKKAIKRRGGFEKRRMKIEAKEEEKEKED